ncbi:hypothetical protein K431DRAFT_131352 [Polychaeton citri CBS 116435]|uniref:Uncharacterized protein n=1 Tax=Polychaeton citri CBS 116435 TaxID=1314669 RepID=A0A9P4QH75_9PEZI|nr:hypothetical protein K431DRAFT_131352 [Polychaeton citri CBS 116435]
MRRRQLRHVYAHTQAMHALHLLNRESMTYLSALNKDGNILNQLGYFPATTQLYQKLWECSNTISSLTRHRLNLNSCHIVEVPPQR